MPDIIDELTTYVVSSEALTIAAEQIAIATNNVLASGCEVQPGFLAGVAASIDCLRQMVEEIEVGIAKVQMEGM